jgi:hypothetical protein
MIVGVYCSQLFHGPISTAPAVEPAMMERTALGLKEIHVSNHSCHVPACIDTLGFVSTSPVAIEGRWL